MKEEEKKKKKKIVFTILRCVTVREDINTSSKV